MWSYFKIVVGLMEGVKELCGNCMWWLGFSVILINDSCGLNLKLFIDDFFVYLWFKGKILLL